MIKIENIIGDSTQPSLDPVVTLYDFDSVLPTLTLAEVFKCISWHILRNFSPNPSFVIFIHVTVKPVQDRWGISNLITGTSYCHEIFHDTNIGWIKPKTVTETTLNPTSQVKWRKIARKITPQKTPLPTSAWRKNVSSKRNTLLILHITWKILWNSDIPARFQVKLEIADDLGKASVMHTFPIGRPSEYTEKTGWIDSKKR